MGAAEGKTMNTDTKTDFLISSRAAQRGERKVGNFLTECCNNGSIDNAARDILSAATIAHSTLITRLVDLEHRVLGQGPLPPTTTKTLVVPDAKPVVYIASPYSKGDPAINVHSQCSVFEALMNDGVVWPVAPLWSHFQHTLFPRRYEDWVAYDLALLPRYDACLRLPARFARTGYHESESGGGDKEVLEFKRLGKPVFDEVAAVYRWAKSLKQGK
jgi:hypothetical protein